MKASIKFRDEQKPLLRAKIPLKILGFPFQSAVSGGDSKEWAMSLSTFFHSGPTLKFSNRPNDPRNPFIFVFKTGIGHFGSPINSPVTISAEFNPIGYQNPTFFGHFRPEFGNFSLKKSHSSDFAPNWKEPAVNGDQNGYFNANNFVPSAVDSTAAARLFLDRIVKGTELIARTAVPLLDLAVVNFRWGLRVPPQDDIDAVVVGTNKADSSSNLRLPLLVMNKISVEQQSKAKGEISEQETKPDKAMEAYLNIKKQVEMIQAENSLLNKALNDLKSDIAAGKLNLIADHRRAGYDKKQLEMFGGGCDQGLKVG